MTLVDRHSSCILAWRVDWERSEPLLQAMVDEAPQAKFYYSDLFATYRKLVYAQGRYTPMPDKSETYRVEGDNADFRHYRRALGTSLTLLLALDPSPTACYQALCLPLESPPAPPPTLSRLSCSPHSVRMPLMCPTPFKPGRLTGDPSHLQHFAVHSLWRRTRKIRF